MLSELEDENKELRRELDELKTEDSEDKPPPSQAESRADSYPETSDIVNVFEVTFYTAYCDTGCTGVTASGHDVSNTIYYEGKRIVAAPPSIPFYTELRIELEDGSSFDAVVLDRGGDITEGRLDVLVSTEEEAQRLGRQTVKVTIKQ